MTTPDSNPEEFWISIFDNLEGFLRGAVQNSNPSFAVRFSWECSCGTWGTARTEDQAVRAIEAHKEHRKDGCGQHRLTKIEAE